MTLSGLVPGILTNRFSLRTHAPRREEVEEVGDVDVAVEVYRCGMAGVRAPGSQQGQEVRDIDWNAAPDVGRSRPEV